MAAVVNFAELLEAHDWVSGGEQFDSEAFVNRSSGEVVLVGVTEDEEEPAELGDPDLYAAVPGKVELGLGKSLALQFVREHIPEASARADQIFQRRGAYSQFKNVLEAVDQLGAWYEYEAEAVHEALRQWATDNGFELDEEARK